MQIKNPQNGAQFIISLAKQLAWTEAIFVNPYSVPEKGTAK